MKAMVWVMQRRGQAGWSAAERNSRSDGSGTGADGVGSVSAAACSPPCASLAQVPELLLT